METVDKASNVNKASNLVHEAINKATNATYVVANEIVDKGDELSNLAHETIDKATTATHEAIDKLGEKRDQLMNAEQRLMKKYSTYVRDNPVTSVGIAIGVGFLLNKLLSNR